MFAVLISLRNPSYAAQFFVKPSREIVDIAFGGGINRFIADGRKGGHA